MDISLLRDRVNPDALTVTELNNYIKNLFDSNRTLSAITVCGEISNFTSHSSGHLYFSLKDKNAQIKAVMFRSAAFGLKFAPESGMRVIVHGSVSVYPQTGSVQIYVNRMQPDGVGDLYLAYEQLKEKLSKEGLFDESHKKQIPAFPSRIGVITSPTGAAVQDIINITGRRYPLARIYLYPSLVQGDEAEDNLIRGLDFFEESKLCDVVIIGRGGGSIEDLWAFNGERLARKIFSMTVPVISAVGHETDFTICDFVSDLRAPTPSAAAELSCPDVRDLSMLIGDMVDRITVSLTKNLERKEDYLHQITSRSIFQNPYTMLESSEENLSFLLQRLLGSINKKIDDSFAGARLLAAKLDALSPLNVLARGYSIIESEGRNIKSVNEVECGQNIKVKLNDGELSATITDKA